MAELQAMKPAPDQIDGIDGIARDTAIDDEIKDISAITIDPVRERQVVRKLDLFIAPVIMLLQLISYLDRSNIGFAATQGLLTDIHLQGSQFNVAVSIFYVFYILAEVSDRVAFFTY
jgi:hypothetical protein